ncbi:Hypothetical protein NTJ_07652 [Nesidiocoris tenuis]|uniref:Lipid-binding serum glycoprotein N-terminal domain-containing protein n=1 Tax=Nesidiocoris tenuis TaxID=355587 RepID=A0ABN7ARJ6_9HEMI|nr:Hypothetical protein NTJ_07652 [Nesidiocoris tenuis]
MLSKFLLGLTLCFANASFLPHELSVLTNELDGDALKSFPNQLTDMALEAVREYLLAKNETTISIPPIDVTFTLPVLGVDFTGKFKARNGIFRNPATIVRKGNSTTKWHFDKPTVLTTIVGFTDMEVYFPEYSASFIDVNESGDVKVNIGTNEIFLQVDITIIPICTVELSKLELRKFEDITTEITGLGILNSLEGLITSWVLSSYETSFTTLIQNIVAEKLKEVLRVTKGFCKVVQSPAVRGPAVQRKVQCKLSKDNKYNCTVD